MRFVIQRVSHASVSAEGRILGKIGRGFLVLIGVSDTDTKETADKMVKKMLGLRIFEDENGKTNLDLRAVEGELLLVSQFTLYADCRRGNRPGFTRAGRRIWQMRCMNISLQNAGSSFRQWSAENLERI